MTQPTKSGPSVDHAVFSSEDSEETREYLDGIYGWRLHGHRPGPEGTRVHLATHASASVATGLAVAGGTMSYDVVGQEYVVVDTLLAGTFELQHRSGTDRHAAGDVFVANQPRSEFTATTRDIRVVTTILPAQLLAEVANPDHDDPPRVRFTSLLPVAGDGRRWAAASRYAQSLFEDPGAAEVPLLLDAVARQLAAAALVTFPNDVLIGAEPSRTAGHDAHPDTLRRAVAFIEANPDADLTVTDIARSAHVSVRAIQVAFRRHLDTTPLGYLRRARLDQVHTTLLDAAPGDGTTVADVAARWGFYSPGRFAEQYRAAYGELPSATLAGTG